MNQLYIQLLGKFSAHSSGQTIHGLDARKVQELLCYLLLYREQPHARETLAGTLWGESASNQAKKALRQTLWQLQSAIDGCKDSDSTEILLAEPDWIQINPKANIWVDIAAFEHAFDRARGLSGNALDEPLEHELRDAVNLYRGDLLEGWYHDWCVYERERFLSMYLTMLDKLMLCCEARRMYEDGIVYGLRILRYDRARECTHRQLMRLYYHAGDRATALRQYERCLATLDEELGVEPSKQTTALYRQIQVDELAYKRPNWELEGEAKARLTHRNLPHLLRGLMELSSELIKLQDQIAEHIQLIERTLEDRY